MADPKSTAAPKTDEAQLTGEPNTKERGWPSRQASPFVGREYYDQFDPRVRPQFTTGGSTSAQMTQQQAAIASAKGGATEHRMVTVYNFQMRDLVLTIPGAMGSALQVTLPPLGVIRAPDEALPLHTSVEGSRHEIIRLASPQGKCDGLRKIKDGHTEYDSCDFAGCPRHGIPDAHPDSPPAKPFIFAHAVIESQRLLTSIGDTLTEVEVKDGKSKRRVTFTPPMEDSVRDCMRLTKIDARSPVSIAVSVRIAWLQRREQEMDKITKAGGQAAGR